MKQKHLYLTSGCCEDTRHISRPGLVALGLNHGWWTGREVVTAYTDLEEIQLNRSRWEFYPLTKEEASFIGEEGFTTGEGFVGLTGYTTLYEGKKWLAPAIEIEWLTEDKFRHGYKSNDFHAVNQDEALKIARQLVGRASRRLKRIGGYSDIAETYDSVDDRWTVNLFIPMEWALKNLTGQSNRDRYCGFLTGLMA